MAKQYTFRLTSEGLAQFQKDLEQAGEKGEAALLRIAAAAPSIGNAMEAAQKKAESARAKLELVTQQNMSEMAARLDAAARQAGENFKSLQASLDPAVAAQQRFARGQDIITEALRRGETDEKTAIRAKQMLSQELKNSTAHMGGFATGLTSVTKMLGVFGIALGAQQIIGWGKEVFNSTAQLVDQATQLQQSTDALQAYRAEFAQGGSTVEAADKAIAKANETIGNAVDNVGNARRELAEWNLDWQALAAAKPDERLGLIARGLLSIEDGTRRARAETALFGRTGREIETILAGIAGGIDGVIARQRALGVIIPADTARKAKESSDAITLAMAQLKTVAAPAVTLFANSLTGLMWIARDLAKVEWGKIIGGGAANFRYMPGQVVPDTSISAAAQSGQGFKPHVVNAAVDNPRLGFKTAPTLGGDNYAAYLSGLKTEADLTAMSAQKRAEMGALLDAANAKLKDGAVHQGKVSEFTGRQATTLADINKILTPVEQAEVRRIAAMKQSGEAAEKIRVTFAKYLADQGEEARIAGQTVSQRNAELALIQAAQVAQKERGVAERDLVQTAEKARKVLGETRTAAVEANEATKLRNELTRDILVPLREELALAGKTVEEREQELQLLRLKQQYGEQAVKLSEEELRNLLRQKDEREGDAIIANMQERVRLAGMVRDEAERESNVLEAMHATHGNLRADQAEQIRQLTDARHETEQMVATAEEVADVIANWAETGKVSLSDLSNIFKRQLAQMAAQALISPIILPIMGAFQGMGGGGIGGAVSQLAMGSSGGGMGFGNVLGSLPVSSMMPNSSMGFLGGIGSQGFGGLFDYAATDALGYGFTMPGSLGMGSLGGLLGGAGLGSMAGSLVFGNKNDASMGSMGGALAGAAIGSIIPGVGTIIGGLIGGLAGGGLGSMTGSSNHGAIANFGGDGTSSYIFKEGGGNNSQMAKAASDSVSAVITALKAQGVTVSLGNVSGLSIGSDKSYVYGYDGMKEKLGGGDVEGVVTSILNKVLPSASGGTAAAQSVLAKYMSSGGINPGNLSQLSSDLGFANTLENLDFSVKQLTQSEQALKAINDQYQQLIDKAASLGLATDQIEAARNNAVSGLVDSFNQTVTDAIDQIRDPMAAAASALSAQQAQRIKEATALGADLTEVYRLNALETEQLTRAQLGQVESTEQLLSQAAALAKQAADFNEGVRVQVLGYSDPLAAALAGEEQAGKERIEKAKALGADILQVEALNALSRQRVIDDFASRAAQAGGIITDSLPSPETLAALAKQAAEFNENVRIQVLGFSDPAAAALAAEDRAGRERVDQARAIGADIVQVEKLNGLARQKIVDDFAAQGKQAAEQADQSLRAAQGNLASLVASLTYGNDSGASPDQKYFAALTNYTAAERAASSNPNDPLAIANFQQAASTLAPIAREFLGTSQSYGRLTSGIVSTATRLGGDLADPSGIARAMVQATSQGSGMIVDAIGVSITHLQSLDGRIAQMTALMQAIINRKN